MAKKSAKIAATYFITIILSLVLVGTVGYFALNAYLNGDTGSGIKPAGDDVQDPYAALSDEYVPSYSHSQTLLFIYEPEKRQTATCFVLARFVPMDSKVVIVPLQTDICVEVDGKVNTLYEFYRLGGTADAVKAVEKALGVSVEKYMKFSKDSFTQFSNLMGNFTYNIPYNLIYENESTGESTVIKSGEQILDAATLRKVLTFPDYNGGEEYRAKMVGAMAVELINSGSKGMLQDSLDVVFTDIINSDIETDITRYDYDANKAAIEYVLDNNTSPAQIVIPSGVYNENNCYVLDESFIQALPSWLAME